MGINKIGVFIPIKEKSERIKNKNFKIINKKPLHYWMINKLFKINLINSIYIDTDSEKIFNFYKNKKKIFLIKRDQSLIKKGISMNEIINFDLKFIKEEHILQTHVTNPLVTEKTIISAINTYFDKIKQGYDSLFSVTEYKKRFYDFNFKPINHNPKKLIDTQYLKPVFEENSNLYIFSKKSFGENNNRIGKKPFFFKISLIESIDIDNYDEFILVKLLMENFKKYV
jgi:N-acylneuraminate cytidylyltransferase